MRKHSLTFVVLVLIPLLLNAGDAGVQCHLPDLQVSVDRYQNDPDSSRPQFVEFSCSPQKGRYPGCTKLGGIGNSLVLFPAVYLSAMLTGRELIIHDESGLGNWCRALKCGFNFTSDAARLYPHLNHVKNVRSMGQNDFSHMLKNNISIPEDIVGFRGMDVYASKWILFAGPLAMSCVKEITGCPPHLLGCVERFAFQKLFPGGFTDHSMPSPVTGLSAQALGHMLTDPYHTIPRFDAAIHIRAQTLHFENNVAKNETAFIEEIERHRILFKHFRDALSSHFFSGTPALFNITHSTDSKLWPRVFISCDDADIRDALVAYLVNEASGQGRFLLVYVNSSHVSHTKHIQYDSSSTPQSTVDTAFDWYSLSLSDAIFAWRKGHTKIPSTFMQSASRVSMVMLSKENFKSKILDKNGRWTPPYEHLDNASEVKEELLRRHFT